MSDKDGGPAFPHEFKYGDGTAGRATGMTLRDYFAAAALTGMLAKRGGYIDDKSREDANGLSEKAPDIDVTAEYCYAQADAMIKERSKP